MDDYRKMQTGACCAGTLCTSPHLQLQRGGHNCSLCKGIVHLNGQCSTASLDDNGDDVFICALCSLRSVETSSVDISSATTPNSAKVVHP